MEIARKNCNKNDKKGPNITNGSFNKTNMRFTYWIGTLRGLNICANITSEIDNTTDKIHISHKQSTKERLNKTYNQRKIIPLFPLVQEQNLFCYVILEGTRKQRYAMY